MSRIIFEFKVSWNTYDLQYGTPGEKHHPIPTPSDFLVFICVIF